MNPDSRTHIKAAREALVKAGLGLQDLGSHDSNRRAAGFSNVLVWGRSITNILQKLRATEADFDTWYAPKQAEMQHDPLMRRFYLLRSQVLKEGRDDTWSSVTIGRNRPVSMEELQPPGPMPPGAVSWFIGDRYGGSGWVMQLPDGTEEKYYVRFEHPEVAVEVSITEPPETHLGAELPRTDLEALCKAYLTYLGQLVAEADRYFSTPVELRS